jgi:hypothetical protein
MKTGSQATYIAIGVCIVLSSTLTAAYMLTTLQKHWVWPDYLYCGLVFFHAAAGYLVQGPGEGIPKIPPMSMSVAAWGTGGDFPPSGGSAIHPDSPTTNPNAN